jgi:hypothetical protein
MLSSRCRAELIFLSLLFSFLALSIDPPPTSAQVPIRAYDMTLEQMFDAIKSNSYEKFVADGDARFKTGFTPKMFNDLARMLGPKLQKGYFVTFLTTLHQQDYIVYVWKLEIKDARDDYLVTLFVKNGLISGFVTR